LYEAGLAKAGLSDVAIAYRRFTPSKSNIDFALEAFNFIREKKNCSVLCVDVSKFFDSIDHQALKRQWRALLREERLPADHYAVYRSLTRFATVNRDRVRRDFNLSKVSERRRSRLVDAKDFRDRVRGRGLIERNAKGKGIPQGSPLSALLANIYMLDFDAELNAMVANCGGLYRRYSDDILIVAPDDCVARLESEMMRLLADLGLSSNPKKRELVRFGVDGHATNSQRVQYLGFLFDGRHTHIRDSSVSRFFQQMRRNVNRARLVAGRNRRRVSRKMLFERFSHLGSRNFISYAYRAERVMNEPAIRRQVRNHWSRVVRLTRR